jgi:hypothetical protein
MNEIATILADGGVYIGGGTLIVILLFLIVWAILRR